MTREIKFKAWDSTRKIMARVTGWDVRGLYSVIDVADKLDGEHWQGDDITLLQFTGLLDKNGVEIYEGDILEIGEGDWLGKYTPVYFCNVFIWKTEVFFQRGAFKIAVSRKGKDGIVFQARSDENLGIWHTEHCAKIIGNIYENPELLNTTTV